MGNYFGNMFTLTDSEIHYMLIDITRAITLVIVVQFLFYAIDGHGQFNSILTIRNILYIIIAMVFYNIIVMKVIGLEREYVKD